MKKKKIRGETGKALYDWEAIKIDFLNSEFLEISEFWRKRFGTETGQFERTNTAGWTKYKKEFKKKMAEDAIKSLEDQEKKNYAIGLKNLMNSILGHVKTENELRKLSLKDKQLLWDILMTMNDKPTVVSKNKQIVSIDPEQEDAILERIKPFLPDSDSE